MALPNIDSRRTFLKGVPAAIIAASIPTVAHAENAVKNAYSAWVSLYADLDSGKDLDDAEGAFDALHGLECRIASLPAKSAEDFARKIIVAFRSGDLCGSDFATALALDAETALQGAAA